MWIRKYEQFTSNYDCRVVIYARSFKRLATELPPFQSQLFTSSPVEPFLPLQFIIAIFNLVILMDDNDVGSKVPSWRFAKIFLTNLFLFKLS